MWLASVSARYEGEIVPTTLWTPEVFDGAERVLRTVLAGVGDRWRERFFRMVVTACFHRALTDEEAQGLPQWWQRHPAVHLAGGPVEVFWQHGVPAESLLATMPCEQPGRQWIKRPLLWVPVDCGQCPPCKARLEAERRVREGMSVS